MNNVVIGLGNTGTQIVKAIMSSSLLNGVSLYAIDSVASAIDLDAINRIKVIPIISDEKTGSGRFRERGRDMYEFHENNDAFAEMYSEATHAKSPVLVITSAAGGTGSGSAPCVCKALMKRNVKVIPIIICPHDDDPKAYHLNTNDLFLELAEIGIETYSVFQNPKNSADYTPINNDVVRLIEIIFGKKYDGTDKDTIDDSDLDSILSVPGRFIATSATANSIENLKKEITRKVFSGYQPAWTAESLKKCGIIMTGFGLKSMFAGTDWETVFSEIRGRLDGFDEYKNLVCTDDSVAEATIIVSGLARQDIKEVDTDFTVTNDLGEGLKKTSRPSFLGNRGKKSFGTNINMGSQKPVSAEPKKTESTPENKDGTHWVN